MTTVEEINRKFAELHGEPIPIIEYDNTKACPRCFATNWTRAGFCTFCAYSKSDESDPDPIEITKEST